MFGDVTRGARRSRREGQHFRHLQTNTGKEPHGARGISQADGADDIHVVALHGRMSVFEMVALGALRSGGTATGAIPPKRRPCSNESYGRYWQRPPTQGT